MNTATLLGWEYSFNRQRKSKLRAKLLAPTQRPFEVLEVFENVNLKLEQVYTQKQSTFSR